MSNANLLASEFTLEQTIIQLGLSHVSDVLMMAMAGEVQLMFRLPANVFILEYDEDGEYVEHYPAQYSYLTTAQCEDLANNQEAEVSVPVDFPCRWDDDIYYDSIRWDKGFKSEYAHLFYASNRSFGLPDETDWDGFIILPPLNVGLDLVRVSLSEFKRLNERLELRALGAMNDLHRNSVLCTRPRYDGEQVYGCSEAFFEAMCGDADLGGQLNSPNPDRIRWTVFEASRRLAGIAPKNYPLNQPLQYIRPHEAVFAAQRLADEIFNLASNEQYESKTPQQWLGWAGAAQIAVYPPCRRLIEEWQQVLTGAKSGLAAEIPNKGRPIARKTKEIETVMAALKKLNQDPLSLAMGLGAKVGTKSQVWSLVANDFISRSAFDSRWKQMLVDKYLKNAPTHS